MDTTGATIIALAVATALLTAASLRLPSLLSTLVTAYLALVAEAGIVTLVLSPFHAVQRTWVGLAAVALFAAAFGAWWLRARPLPSLAPVRRALVELAGDPIIVLFVAVAAVVLAYELLLVVTVPANNWDALTYHLPRAAAWLQHGGLHWIANAPSDRLNEFQPLAEQEILFLFAATGTGALFALPQYVAELAILVAVYGASRRLGFSLRAAAGSACLLATFSLVALEATTAQNDLVAASLPVVAAFLLLGSSRAEFALAGAALGMGLGVKLTTGLVWPALALLAVVRGRVATALVCAGAACGLVAVGMWGYVLNIAHTGHVLGYGASRVENTASPSFPGSLHVALRVVYRMLDLSVLSNRLIYVLAAIGVLAGVVVGVMSYRRRLGKRRVALDSAFVSIPLLAPILVLAGAAAFAFVTRIVHLRVDYGGFGSDLNRRANEDYSSFGPLGAVALLGVPLLTLIVSRADRRRLAFASALPVFLVLLALESKYNPFLTRFLLVPAVLTAPLFGLLFRTRVAGASLLAAAVVIVVLTLGNDQTKPLLNVAERPWRVTQSQALARTFQPELQATVNAYDALVPIDACVGAIVGPDEPSYLLWRPKLTHRVVYLPALQPLEAAYRAGVFYVVVSPAADGPSAAPFESAGWRARPLGTYWVLLTSPRPGLGGCGV